MRKVIILLVLFLEGSVSASLISDLEMATYWDRKMRERLPVTFNYLLAAGYFTTHSARMREAGEFGFGGASVPPYTLTNFHFQPFSHLEVTGNYRVFNGVRDAGLSPHGFGDFSDRAAGIKLALAIPEDSCNELPGFAIGIDDFVGSKRFWTPYLALTQVWMDYGLETTLGWGAGRYSRGPSRGFFGGAAWYPFFACNNKWTKGVALAIEYDPTDYRKDPHPKGTKTASHINVGLHYNFSDLLAFSFSSLRGKKIAASCSLHANFGKACGFLPKICDPLPYYGGKVPLRNLFETFCAQGFFLREISSCENHLTLTVINQKYLFEQEVRCRLQHLLFGSIPDEFTFVTVILESYALPVQQYTFTRDLLCRAAFDQIGPFELDLLTPRCEAIFPKGETIFRRSPLFFPTLAPRLETFLGSRKGKVKYAFGLKSALEGLLPYGIIYDLQFCYTPLSTAKDVSDFDFYNPSQLPNVLTDFVNYRKAKTFSTERAFLQKNWNSGKGWFTRLCGGYFQVNYAGVGGEILFYPVRSYFAAGIEGALLKKRRYTGLLFQDKLRKLNGNTPTYIPYTLLSQYFLNLYLDIPEWKMASRLSVGGFLAHDKGALFELTRYFASGLRVSAWMTFTNAYDKVHGENYFNRGVALEIPFDLFCMRRSRRVCSWGMAAWLRDAGAFIPTGHSLFELVNRERRN